MAKPVRYPILYLSFQLQVWGRGVVRSTVLILPSPGGGRKNPETEWCQGDKEQNVSCLTDDKDMSRTKMSATALGETWQSRKKCHLNLSYGELGGGRQRRGGGLRQVLSLKMIPAPFMMCVGLCWVGVLIINNEKPLCSSRRHSRVAKITGKKCFTK